MFKSHMHAMTSTCAVFASFVALSTAALANTASTPPSVVVFDQAVANTSVDVSYAFLPAKGYVAVHGSDSSGKPSPQALGSAEVAAGDHRNIKVLLNQQPSKGQKLWVALYRDADGKAGFDAAGDKAIWPASLPSENAFLAR